MLLERIYKQLSLLTKDMNSQEKIKFLKTLGYNHHKEIERLTEDERQHLLTALMTKNKDGYIIEELKGTMSGYTISRAKNPRTVKDVGFYFKGLTQE